jgi:predicted nuclease with TOPRIM domain
MKEELRLKKLARLNRFRETLKEVQRQRSVLRKRLQRRNKRIHRLKKKIQGLIKEIS